SPASDSRVRTSGPSFPVCLPAGRVFAARSRYPTPGHALEGAPAPRAELFGAVPIFFLPILGAIGINSLEDERWRSGTPPRVPFRPAGRRSRDRRGAGEFSATEEIVSCT